jgi:uncharacterized protein (DUF488 family)
MINPNEVSTDQEGSAKPEITFHTMGYEQSEPEEFIGRLKQHRVTLVVDIRHQPISRKHSFSKRNLEAGLAEAGIKYIHLQSLGAPKDLREGLKAGGSWWNYVKRYTAEVLDHRGEDVDFLIDLASRECISLLCFERDPEACHRNIVAKEMMKRANGKMLFLEHIKY